MKIRKRRAGMHEVVTTSLTAEELSSLGAKMLISRDKFYIVFDSPMKEIETIVKLKGKSLEYTKFKTRVANRDLRVREIDHRYFYKEASYDAWVTYSPNNTGPWARPHMIFSFESAN